MILNDLKKQILFIFKFFVTSNTNTKFAFIDCPYFRLVSNLDNRAVFGSEDGTASMQTRDETCEGQLW